jgi:hypothetical protein
MERILLKLKQEMQHMEDGIFATPPSDWGAYLERLGRWKGLGQAISIIEEEILDAREAEERS